MKYSKELTIEIIENIKEGLSVKDICSIVGISEETYYAWKREKPEFSESVERGFMEFKIACIRTLRDAKDWKASAWLLERRYPQEYSTKHIVIEDMTMKEEPFFTKEEEEKIDMFLRPRYKCEECGHRGEGHI